MRRQLAGVPSILTRRISTASLTSLCVLVATVNADLIGVDSYRSLPSQPLTLCAFQQNQSASRPLQSGSFHRVPALARISLVDSGFLSIRPVTKRRPKAVSGDVCVI